VVTDVIDVDAERLNRHLETIETESFDFPGLAAFGAALGELVLPPLVRDALAGIQDRHLVVIHDARASRVPWETLNIDGWFPAAEAGVSRKYEAENLTVAKWLEERRLAPELRVLLVANPTLDLPGADEEGERVGALLRQAPSVRLTELRREAATFGAVRAALRSGEFDVVHYAGHAFFDPVNRARSGLLCHGRQVLSGHDLATLEHLPALVFFNACEAARVRSASARRQGRETARRLETNVGLAEALLRAGVGNYLGTYWPVGDLPAQAFAEAFYGSLIGGEPLGAALAAGRRRVRERESVDWADYVHYGSPGFVVKRRD
jgi:CHAT domain-containing protein